MEGSIIFVSPFFCAALLAGLTLIVFERRIKTKGIFAAAGLAVIALTLVFAALKSAALEEIAVVLLISALVSLPNQNDGAAGKINDI